MLLNNKCVVIFFERITSAWFVSIGRKVEGSPDQQRDAAVKRGEFREILGDKLMREITLK